MKSWKSSSVHAIGAPRAGSWNLASPHCSPLAGSWNLASPHCSPSAGSWNLALPIAAPSLLAWGFLDSSVVEQRQTGCSLPARREPDQENYRDQSNEQEQETPNDQANDADD